MIEQYPQQVKIVFKNFPLRNHRFALKAAQAAIAAGKQGQFWAFHDQLFKRYNRLSDPAIDEIRAALNLNAQQFKADMQAPDTIAQINADVSEANRAGVHGTPTVFINGRLLRDKSLGGFQAMINFLLQQPIARQ
ncbi:DsbA oxidoreductase (fragment) [Desulfosarcina cetonica]